MDRGGRYRGYQGNNDFEFFSKNITNIAQQISARIGGKPVIDVKIEKTWRRMKRISHPAGLVDIFYDRDFSNKGRMRSYNIASIRFTADDKMDYSGAYQARLETDRVLNEYEIGFHIYEAELPVDTIDADAGKAIRLYGVLNRWRGKAQRGVDNDEEPIEQGFNEDGNRNYQNGRRYSKDCLAYEKEYEDTKIYRFEPTYRRGFLRQRRIDNHEQLAENAQRLVSDTLYLKVPDVEKIQRYLSGLSSGRKSWLTRYCSGLGLSNAVINDPNCVLPSMGWINILFFGAGLSKSQDRRRFFETYKFPEVSLCV